MIYEGVGDVDVEEMLEQLGLDNVAPVGRGEVQYSCPFVSGHSYSDSHPSAHMNREKLVYRCKACGRAGSALDLVGSVLACSPAEALRWLRERYGDTFRAPEGGIVAEMRAIEDKREERRRSQQVASLPDEGDTIGRQGIFAIDWSSDHDAAAYMRDRGFTVETISDWALGYDGWTNRVAIPIRNRDGRLIGFKGRSINPHDHTRYSLLGDTPDRKPRYGVGYGFSMHDTATVVFGLDRALVAQASQRRKVAVIVEGELNAIALAACGVRNAVAIGMTTMSVQQERMLRWYFDEVVLLYDTDEAGTAATWGYYDDKERWHPGLVDRLSSNVRVRVADEHDLDPADMLQAGQAQELRELVKEAPSWMSIAIS